MKKVFKKIVSIALISAMTATMFTACGKDEKKDSDKLKIGVIQMIENGAFNDMREGFIEELKAKGYDTDKADIEYKCAQGDATNLQTIAQSMSNGTYDLVCTIATPATQAMVNMESDTPVVFVAVSAPVAAGVITDMDKPDKNATGTSNAIPVDDIFALSDELTPGNETYGFLYCTSEVNSVNTVESAKAYCDEHDLKYKEATVTNSSEVQQAVESLVGKVDAIFIPNDSVIQSAMTLVTDVARENKIPVYGSSATMVDSGAFATVAISDKEIGAMSADMAVEILKGKKVSEVPAVVVPASATVINTNTLDALGITLSDDIMNTATFVEDAK
ncbi:MAG: ABC transporter substrate-binding protein [Lachnospiraceae bacterium]|nr:ABC transporter substrate-binding protein [Lachnospiraceae bacterium]